MTFFWRISKRGQNGYKAVTLCNNYNSTDGKINPILLFPSFFTEVSAHLTIAAVENNNSLANILSAAVGFHLILTFALCNFTRAFCGKISQYGCLQRFRRYGSPFFPKPFPGYDGYRKILSPFYKKYVEICGKI